MTIARLKRIALALTATALLTAQIGLREDEFLCEEAARKLAMCFPSSRPFDCTYHEGCDKPRYPELSIADSKLINSRPCEELTRWAAGGSYKEPRCEAPWKVCGGVCVDPATDWANCGDCGHTCDVAHQAQCVQGACCDGSVDGGCP